MGTGTNQFHQQQQQAPPPKNQPKVRLDKELFLQMCDMGNFSLRWESFLGPDVFRELKRWPTLPEF